MNSKPVDQIPPRRSQDPEDQKRVCDFEKRKQRHRQWKVDQEHQEPPPTALRREQPHFRRHAEAHMQYRQHERDGMTCFEIHSSSRSSLRVPYSLRHFGFLPGSGELLLFIHHRRVWGIPAPNHLRLASSDLGQSTHRPNDAAAATMHFGQTSASLCGSPQGCKVPRYPRLSRARHAPPTSIAKTKPLSQFVLHFCSMSERENRRIRDSEILNVSTTPFPGSRRPETGLRL
jgi:hypothetical protein